METAACLCPVLGLQLYTRCVSMPMLSPHVKPERDRLTYRVPGELEGPKGSRPAEQSQSICTIDFSHAAAGLMGGVINQDPRDRET